MPSRTAAQPRASSCSRLSQPHRQNHSAFPDPRSQILPTSAVAVAFLQRAWGFHCLDVAEEDGFCLRASAVRYASSFLSQKLN